MKKAREEWVRQELKNTMIHDLGYPYHELIQEVSLSNIQHLKNQKNVPLRRLDLVCLSRNVKEDHDLFPLIIIECKAHKLNQKAFDQLCGYNSWVEAPFVAVSNFHQTIMGAWDSNIKRYKLINRLLPYHELKHCVAQDL